MWFFMFFTDASCERFKVNKCIKMTCKCIIFHNLQKLYTSILHNKNTITQTIPPQHPYIPYKQRLYTT